MKDFKGKTAFVTGGASGIGLAMARAFGRQGMNVVIADIEDAPAKVAVERLASEQIKAVSVHCDVGERNNLRAAALQAVSAFGKVHVVCNNAGVGAGGEIGKVPERDWDWIVDVNLKSVYYGVETFLPLIRSHGEGGHFVNTASIAGLISGPGMEPYSATKYAVVAMSEGWAMQLAGSNIGMSVLCPGFVRTRIHESARTKQARFGGTAGPESFDPDRREMITKAIETGLDPDVVGARVVEAVRDNQLYIFTDPRFKDVVEMRFAAIRNGFQQAEESEALKSVKSWPPLFSSALGG
ncbi:MAG TPA: SDR family NAD(P)-dependent oxidoreductase [Rhizomicrobium sp.]|nr:SDR family NAD(P)-dependent oxidoreductase [Rhizomicrobium sp.]